MLIGGPPGNRLEDRLINSVQDLVPFPIFHGTSRHYLSAFKPGYTPASRPYRDVALGLLSDAWEVLSLRRCEIPDDVREKLFWDVTHEEIPCMVKEVIEQASGHCNWHHGKLFLTSSKRTAVSDACGGARYGRELLTFCKTAIDAVARLDDKKAKELKQTTESLAKVLRDTKRPPVTVEFDDIKVAALDNGAAQGSFPRLSTRRADLMAASSH